MLRPRRGTPTGALRIGLGWLEEQIQALTRPDDRALFGLDAEPYADADKTELAAARSAPITARQKNLLAKLVEAHPQLARELGVNPDATGLEEFRKAKAASLIRAMLDRQRAGAARDER